MSIVQTGSCVRDKFFPRMWIFCLRLKPARMGPLFSYCFPYQRGMHINAQTQNRVTLEWEVNQGLQAMKKQREADTSLQLSTGIEQKVLLFNSYSIRAVVIALWLSACIMIMRLRVWILLGTGFFLCCCVVLLAGRQLCPMVSILASRPKCPRFNSQHSWKFFRGTNCRCCWV